MCLIGFRAEREQNSCQNRLAEWLEFRTAFLDEALRHDGLGDFLHHSTCGNCGIAPGIIKCKDCSCGPILKCAECIVSLHWALPLHRIEVRTHVLCYVV